MFRDRVSSLEDHRRFIERVIASESVWCLRGEEGIAYCESNDDDERTVLVFWSDHAYAERARKSQFPEYEPDEIPLFDFLFRWLTGMSGDGVLAGTNWTGDLIGTETEPDDLKDQITDQMPRDMLGRYMEQLKQALADQEADS